MYHYHKYHLSFLARFSNQRMKASVCSMQTLGVKHLFLVQLGPVIPESANSFYQVYQPEAVPLQVTPKLPSMLEQSTCFVPLPAATLNFVTTTPQSWLGEQFKLPTTPLYFVDLAVHQNHVHTNSSKKHTLSR